jgi:predicted ATPase
LQALAGPNSVIVSDRTLRLLHGTFDVEDLGLRHVQGLSDLPGPFRVLRERRAEDRFEAMHATRLTPLVGREEELALLIGRWALAKEGEGQVVAFRGEPGIGKSRILRTLRERLESERPVRVSYQCSPFFTNTAFYPVIDQLQRAAGFTEDDPAEARLEKLDAWLASAGSAGDDAGPLLAALLSLKVEGRTLPLRLSPQRQKERTIEVLVAQLTRRARAEGLLVVFEDVHWIDPSTAELLDRLVAQVAESRVLLLVTYRPTFEPSWVRYAHVTVHSLNRLSKRHCALMATKVADKALPEALVHHIVDKTDGVPLFVEELTKAVIESNLVTDAGDRYELAGDVDMVRVPATLHDSLMARLDRLIPMKEVAQIGAAIGREFSYALLAAVSPMQEDELQAALERIVDSELVHRQGSPPDAVYVFKHALVQDAAYDSLLKRRKVELHQRIAQALEQDFPETIDTQPELIAHHYTAATVTEKAVPYWLKAGLHALRASALEECVDHLSRGLKLLLTLPGGRDRDAQEIDFQAALGTAQMMWKGYANPATGAAYQRADALLTGVGDSPQQFPVLWGVWAYYLVQPDYKLTYEAAQRALGVAERADDAGLMVQALSINCVTHFWMKLKRKYWTSMTKPSTALKYGSTTTTPRTCA